MGQLWWSWADRIGPGDSFREVEVLTTSRYTPEPVLPSSRTDPSVYRWQSGL